METESAPASPKICLFLPAYNVQETIVPVLEKIPSDVRDRVGAVLVVDNRSQDETLERLLTHARKTRDPKLHVLRNDLNYSLGGSTIVAFDWAIAQGFDFVICMHTDGQADPRDLLKMLPLCREEMDFVFGSRMAPGAKVEDYSPLRMLGNRFFAWLQRRVTRADLDDIGAFIAFNLKTVRTLPFSQIPHGMAYHPLVVLLAARNLRIRTASFPISWGKVERSNVNPFVYGIGHLWRLILIWRNRLPLTGKRPEDFISRQLWPEGA